MKRVVLGAAAFGLLGVLATVTGFAATLGVESGTIDTFSAGSAATTTTTTTPPAGDTRAPALVSLEMFDVDADGRVDQVKATFDEALASDTAGTAPWTLTDVPSGGALASVSVNGAVAALAITEGGGAEDTAVGSFTVALAQHAAGVRDAAGNRSSFAATGPLDRARPRVLSILISNGGGDSGRPEHNDTVTASFSEPLAPNAVCPAPTDASWTAPAPTLDDDNSVSVVIMNAAPDVLNVTSTSCDGGLRFGSVALGNNGFVTSTGTFRGAGANGSVLRLLDRSVTVTLGQLVSGATGDVNASSVNVTYTPHPDLSDSAGNKVIDVATHQDRQF